MTLREKKSAKIKLNILHTTLEMIGKRSFSDLYVDQVCERVGVSKVTFFKYFPQKEDVLIYYLRMWCFKRAVEFRDHGLTGLKGIYYLFDKMSEDCEQYPGLVLSLVGYLTELKRTPKPVPVKLAERLLLFPELEGLDKVQIHSIDQIMERLLLDAIFNKEVTKSGNVKELANLLLTVFYGSIITAHIQKLSSLKPLFRRNADVILNSLR